MAATPIPRLPSSSRTGKRRGGHARTPLSWARVVTVVLVAVATVTVLFSGLPGTVEVPLLAVIVGFGLVLDRILLVEAERPVDGIGAVTADVQEFASLVSHDLREPMRTAAGFLTLLEKRHADELGDDGRALLQHALASNRRGQDLVEDLLAWARAGADGAARDPVSLDRVVADAMARLGDRISATGAELHVAPLPIVCGDALGLGQVVQNLLHNAMKFSGGKRPVIDIDAVREDDAWVLRVADNGIGVPESDADRIFGMFTRLHPPSRYEGTGIGLAICDRIVRSHGGRMWVQPRDGGGSVFVVRLPQTSATSNV